MNFNWFLLMKHEFGGNVISWYFRLVTKVRFNLFSILIELLYIMLCLASTSVGANLNMNPFWFHLNVSVFLNCCASRNHS